MKMMNKFISVHAICFVFYNMVHLTNWIMNGPPKHFSGLKVLWIASGLARQRIHDALNGSAGGNIGADVVYIAAPDGYTLLASQPSPITTNVLLYRHMAFDPTKFEPASITSTIANVLMVRPNFPAKTAKQFIAYAKARSDKINFGSQGIGTTSHLTTALFEQRTGIKIVHIPYKGTAPGSTR